MWIVGCVDSGMCGKWIVWIVGYVDSDVWMSLPPSLLSH